MKCRNKDSIRTVSLSLPPVCPNLLHVFKTNQSGGGTVIGVFRISIHSYVSMTGTINL